MHVDTHDDDAQARIARGAPGVPPKLAIDKFSDGAILLLRFTGTIDEAFDGKQLGATVNATTLIVDLGGVKKISSFGIREWVDFITAAGARAAAIVIVECAPKVIDQLNMVANFAGKGRVFSFYAPFRCDYCDSEHRVLLQVDRDRDAIKAMKLAERPCVTCGEPMYFDDDGATFFSYLNGAEPFELAPEIAAFLAAKLDYAVRDASRKLRVDKVVDGRATYLRLSGELDRSFPRDKLAEGLEGTVIVDVAALARIEPAGAAEWRAFVQLVTPFVEQLCITGAAGPFLERLATAHDLGAKAQVLSIVLPYACAACGTTSAEPIDVAAHHAVLKFATAPELRCHRCAKLMACTAPESVMTRLPALALPALDAELRAAIERLRERALVPAPAKQPAGVARAEPPRVIMRTPMWIPVAAAVLAVAIAGGALLAYRALTGTASPPAGGLGAIAERSAEARPPWVGSAAPGAASCVDTSEHGLACTAASAISLAQDDAVDDAADSAIDELAAALATRISDPGWRGVVPPIYQASRDAKLAAYARDPTATVARREVHEARHAVAALARTTSGGAIPAAPTADYWERYDTADGKRWVAFAQLTITHAQLARLTETYTAQRSAAGATAIDVFPLLAWRYPQLGHGAVIEVGAAQPIALPTGGIVLSVDGHEVAGAAAFAARLAPDLAEATSHGGSLLCSVQVGDGPPSELAAQLAPARAPTPAPTPTSPTRGPAGGAVTPALGGVNVWDRYADPHASRGSGRDDPDQ